MTPDQILRTYADLAELYERQGQPKHRDWFLVLAADAALSAQQPAEADRLLGRLLSVNPHHFLRPFASFAEALRSPDVQGYVGNLKRNYPPDKAQELLQSEQRKRGDEQEEPRRPARPVPAPPLAQPPREQPEVLFARVRSAPQEEAEAHFAPEPEPPAQPEPPPPPRPAPPSPPRAPMPKPRPITRPARDEAPPEDELNLEDKPPPLRPKPAAERKPRRGARQAAKPEPAPDTNPVLPSFLFLLLLLATLALAAYALLGPLLPEFKP